jgi:uroporphyrinogen decarboxylase
VNGPFLSPKTFEQLVFPYFRKLIDSFKKHGVKVLLHCDGQIIPLIDDMVEMGFDGLEKIFRSGWLSVCVRIQDAPIRASLQATLGLFQIHVQGLG